MSVRSLDSSISSLLSTPTTPSSSASTSSSSADAVPTDTSDVSSGAKLFDQLKALEQSDPARFKTVVSSIADQLQTEAQSATGGKASFLNDLASRFQQAGQTGDLSALQPPVQPSGPPPSSTGSGDATRSSGGAHHHHHAKYTQGSSESADSLQSIIANALQQVGASTDTSQTGSAS